jgi:hypothetical protein
VKSSRLTNEQNVLKRIRELREETVNLIDYLDLLEARARNLGRRRYHPDEVKNVLKTEFTRLPR